MNRHVPIDFTQIKTVEDCDALIEKLTEVYEKLVSQIEHGRIDLEEGEDVDRHWLVRVDSARRFVGADRHRVIKMRNKIEAAEKRERHPDEIKQVIEVQRANALLKHERMMSRDRHLLDFIKTEEPEVFRRCVDRWMLIHGDTK